MKSVGQVAAMIGRSRYAVYRAINAGHVEATKIGEGTFQREYLDDAAIEILRRLFAAREAGTRE